MQKHLSEENNLIVPRRLVTLSELFTWMLVILTLSIKEIITPSFYLGGYYLYLVFLLLFIAVIVFLFEIINFFISKYVINARIKILNSNYSFEKKIITISGILYGRFPNECINNKKIYFMYDSPSAEGTTNVKVYTDTIWKSYNEFQSCTCIEEVCRIEYLYIIVSYKYFFVHSDAVFKVSI